MILCLCRECIIMYFAFSYKAKLRCFTYHNLVLFWYSVTLLYILQKFECFAIIIFCVLSTRFLPAFSCLIGSASFPWGRWCLSHVTLLFTIYEKKRQMAMLIHLVFIGSLVLHQFFTIWARRRDGNSDKYTAHRKSVSCYIHFYTI